MVEALLYDRQKGSVSCRLCPHLCSIPDAGRGLCGVRENKGGTLHTLVWGRPCATHVDPIEKKPFFHFMPGTRSFSISTVGCNLSCAHCQNHGISQASKSGEIPGFHMEPQEVVDEALDRGCASIAYTYTEPTIFLEYALDIAKLAKDAGLKNVFVSNGFMSEQALDLIAPYLDADNVDLKSFSDGFYRKYCGARLEPVLDTLRRLKDRGIWTEVTTLVIPTLNDSQEELEALAGFILEDLGDQTPWHVSRFHPDYKMTKLPPTDISSVEDIVNMGQDMGLKHVYAGNVPHGDHENTRCPGCGCLAIERRGYAIVKDNMKGGACSECGTEIEGVWDGP